ncbi:MAG: peptide chain release factor N(5)-glutamine methyltransferase, partial [Eubacterium sp.]|nr:peptide chain release factor N(5)-glutamine methyltransferase [Eubacterium sp.]
DISEMLREQNVSIINSDIFSNIHERYDIIISNPPYIKSGDIPGLMPEVKVYEPRLALDGVAENTDGLTFYEKIIKDASKVLNKNGKICFEIGSDEGEAVRRLLVDNSFDDINVMKDINGRDRIVTAIVQ